MHGHDSPLSCSESQACRVCVCVCVCVFACGYVCACVCVCVHVCVQFGPYGTRSQTVMVVWSDGHTDLCERYLVPVGSNGVVSPPSNQQTSQETASGQADVSMAASAGRVEQSDGVQGQVHTGCNVCGSVSCEPPGTHFLGRTEGEARVGEWCWSRHSFDMTLKCN